MLENRNLKDAHNYVREENAVMCIFRVIGSALNRQYY